MTDTITQIKEALEKASLEHPWDTDGRTVEWKNGSPVKGTYRAIAVTDSIGEIFTNENHKNDAHLIANSPTWLQYLIDELEKAQKALASCVEERDAACGYINQLESEHTTMREALEWYAAESTYDISHLDKHGFILIDQDSGERAKSVLSTLSHMKGTPDNEQSS